MKQETYNSMLEQLKIKLNMDKNAEIDIEKELSVYDTLDNKFARVAEILADLFKKDLEKMEEEI